MGKLKNKPRYWFLDDIMESIEKQKKVLSRLNEVAPYEPNEVIRFEEVNDVILEFHCPKAPVPLPWTEEAFLK